MVRGGKNSNFSDFILFLIVNLLRLKSETYTVQNFFNFPHKKRHHPNKVHIKLTTASRLVSLGNNGLIFPTIKEPTVKFSVLDSFP